MDLKDELHIGLGGRGCGVVNGHKGWVGYCNLDILCFKVARIGYTLFNNSLIIHVLCVMPP